MTTEPQSEDTVICEDNTTKTIEDNTEDDSAVQKTEDERSAWKSDPGQKQNETAASKIERKKNMGKPPRFSFLYSTSYSLSLVSSSAYVVCNTAFEPSHTILKSTPYTGRNLTKYFWILIKKIRHLISKYFLYCEKI